jgi:hypothetical protein
MKKPASPQLESSWLLTSPIGGCAVEKVHARNRAANEHRAARVGSSEPDFVRSEAEVGRKPE